MTGCYLCVVGRDGRRDRSGGVHPAALAQEMAAWFNEFRPDMGEHFAIPEAGIEWWLAEDTTKFRTVAIRPDGHRHVDPMPVSEALARALVARLNADCASEGEHFAVPVARLEEWKAGTWTP